jgi:DNA helicase-2/ATP-dependent DNA helicase PcrA
MLICGQVGDDYQAIYGWRGSDVRYMLDFKNSYEGASIHALKVNYRSGRHILQAAENLSNHFLEGFRKKLTPSTEDTGAIYYDELSNEADEAQTLLEEIQLRLDAGIPADEIAVLSRTNKRPIKIASKLLQNGIPVDLKDGVLAFDSFHEKQLIQAASVASGVFLSFKWPRIPKGPLRFLEAIRDRNLGPKSKVSYDIHFKAFERFRY